MILHFVFRVWSSGTCTSYDPIISSYHNACKDFTSHYFVDSWVYYEWKKNQQYIYAYMKKWTCCFYHNRHVWILLDDAILSWTLLRMKLVYISLLLPILSMLPSQCYSNGPGNMGSQGSNKEIQAKYWIRLGYLINMERLWQTKNTTVLSTKKY